MSEKILQCFGFDGIAVGLPADPLPGFCLCGAPLDEQGRCEREKSLLHVALAQGTMVNYVTKRADK
jgi:hypothetical protein